MEGIVKTRNKEVNQHFRYQISCSIEAVIVSVFVLLSFHILNRENRE